ncbi:MAG: sulfatase-like hydrolase/transferase [Bacteroidota bacterium]
MKRILASPTLWIFCWLCLSLAICVLGPLYGVPNSAWLNGEWLLLGIGLLWLNPQGKRTWTWLWWGAWAFLVFLQLYGLFTWRLYRVSPNLYHEWSLLTEVLPIFWSELSLGKLSAYLPLLLAAILGVALSFALLRFLLRRPKLWGGVPAGISVLSLILLLGIFSGNLQWSSAQIWQNWQDSRQLYQEVNTKPALEEFTQNWSDSLLRRPDIYLIFLESYGKVLATEEAFKAPYFELIEELETRLAAKNWGMRSTWSEAPISGGRSWLGFTSLMTGQKLYAHPQYTALLKRAPDYPHLVRYLNDQGYYSLRMNTLEAKTQAAKIPYALYDRFFAFDDWLKNPDFPYEGPAYGKFGSLPDQFALGYAREEVIKERSPFFLFFITLNSHSPWNDVPVLAEDWRELESLPDTAQSGQASSLMAGLAEDKYWRAMDYQLRMMTQFIEQQGDSNSLFIFLGDHQPPFLTDAGDDFATPVHIVSQDPFLLDRFAERSFVSGLQLDGAEAAQYRHEDFYMLLRAVLSQKAPLGLP